MKYKFCSIRVNATKCIIALAKRERGGSNPQNLLRGYATDEQYSLL